jgi:ABC-type nitrate/sulfonate/bicarbonate transport system permease component
LIPLFILWFGIGRAPQILLVGLGSAVILSVSTMEAVRNVPRAFCDAAATLGATKADIYRTVVIPCITPHLIGAARVAAASVWGLDVAAELMGSQQGLGYLIALQQSYLNTAGIIALLFVYAALAFGLDILLNLTGRHLTAWAEREQDL